MIFECPCKLKFVLVITAMMHIVLMRMSIPGCTITSFALNVTCTPDCLLIVMNYIFWLADRAVISVRNNLTFLNPS